MFLVEKGGCEGRDEPVMARSRSRSSEFGACSHSVKSTFSNSVPMMGVRSKDWYFSRDLPSFSGLRAFSWMGSWCCSSLIAADGAMLLRLSRRYLLYESLYYGRVSTTTCALD